MNLTVPIAMFGWPFVSLAMFLFMPARRATLISMLAGWFLLPTGVAYPISGFPDYTREMATLIGALAGMALFDLPRVLKVSWSWHDLAMLCWCVCPIPSSLTNGLGLYDGLSGMIQQFIEYGTPYLIGRVYYAGFSRDSRLVREIVLAGLLTVPFVLIELRMGPMFHRLVYGYEQFKWHQIWRLGWYRPPVFLRSGLALGAWFAFVGILAVWAWRSKLYKRLMWMSPGTAAGVLGVIVLLMRALNGYGIFVLGLGALMAGRVLRARWVLVAFALVPALYIGSRATLNWEGGFLVDKARLISADRAASLESRLEHEVLLIEHALKKPVFGWGTYNRNRPDILPSEKREGMMGDRSITDSLWVITLGQKGLVGLASLGGVLLLPALIVGLRIPAPAWASPQYGAVTALAVVSTAFTYDALVNAMYNPVVLVASGAALGTLSQIRRRRAPRRVAPPPVDGPPPVGDAEVVG